MILKNIIKEYRIGKLIYRGHRLADKKRAIVFAFRNIINEKVYKQFKNYCDNYKPYPDMLIENLDVSDIIGRVFLYKDSTPIERFLAWKNHFDLLEKYFFNDFIYQLYHRTGSIDDELSSPGKILYFNEELDLVIRLAFSDGQRKEGFMTIFIEYKNERLYHLNFRFGKDSNDIPVLIIGTIQGKPNGLDDSKKLTKKMFGYRPKNLVLYVLRIIAETLGIDNIYAVSDYGFYANSHIIRIHRSKNVYYDDFWKECGGIVCESDKRFFKLPIKEARKTYETAKTHKRNMYKKRYELLDIIKNYVNNSICQNVKL